MVLLSTQGMDAVKIADVTFTSPDRVRDVLHNFNADGLRLLLREQDVSFQAVKTWKTSTDPDYESKKNRVLEL